MIFLKSFIELSAIMFILYGVCREKDLIAFEQRTKRKICKKIYNAIDEYQSKKAAE